MNKLILYYYHQGRDLGISLVHFSERAEKRFIQEMYISLSCEQEYMCNTGCVCPSLTLELQDVKNKTFRMPSEC